MGDRALRPGESHTPETVRYHLRQHLNAANRSLRDAEDLARMEMPAYPTADRIRSIYEQITADVLNGTTTEPPIKQRLDEAESSVAHLRAQVELAVVALKNCQNTDDSHPYKIAGEALKALGRYDDERELRNSRESKP